MKPNAGLDEHRVGPTTASARADVYAILSACFTPPTSELLDAAKSGALAEALEGALAELPVEQAAFQGALRSLEALPLALSPSGPHGTLHTLEVEYTRLFLGPGLPKVPPYESVYADQIGRASCRERV